MDNAVTQDVKVVISKSVEASADQVWSVVKKMDKINEYSEFITKVEWSGELNESGERVCYTPEGQGGPLTEKILTFDENDRSYSYSVIGMPAVGMINSFKVVENGSNGATIVWTCHYDSFVENPKMNEEELKGALNHILNEILDNQAKEAVA